MTQVCWIAAYLRIKYIWIAEYSQLSSSRVSQRVSVAYNAGFQLLHYLLACMFADVERITPDEYIQEGGRDKDAPVPVSVLRVLDIVTVLHEPPLVVLQVRLSDVLCK